ncbi:MAG: hypothetical protein R3E50_04840 [Halioglobus sp.]
MSIEFKVTRDSRLLDQYYALRQSCFRQELGLPDFDGAEEEQDRQGRILLALQDGQCVGGVRISPHITLSSQLELLELDEDYCCMWERFVVDPSVRTVYMVREFISRVIETSRDSGYRNAMVLSSLRNARFYRRCHTALGVGFQIHRPVPHCARGAFAGLEHYLSVAHLYERQPLRIAI